MTQKGMEDLLQALRLNLTETHKCTAGQEEETTIPRPRLCSFIKIAEKLQLVKKISCDFVAIFLLFCCNVFAI
jgi:hypothetical protein